MCLSKDGESPKTSSAEGSPVQPPRSPWAKLLNRQNLKPRLPRKITASARVNLNKYWSKFGELMAPRSLEPEVLVLPFSELFYPVDTVKPSPPDSDNEINADITNGNRFEIIPQDGVEVSENLANEVKEICFSTRNCFVCSL